MTSSLLLLTPVLASVDGVDVLDTRKRQRIPTIRARSSDDRTTQPMPFEPMTVDGLRAAYRGKR